MKALVVILILVPFFAMAESGNDGDQLSYQGMVAESYNQNHPVGNNAAGQPYENPGDYEYYNPIHPIDDGDIPIFEPVTMSTTQDEGFVDVENPQIVSSYWSTPTPTGTGAE